MGTGKKLLAVGEACMARLKTHVSSGFLTEGIMISALERGDDISKSMGTDNDRTGGRHQL